MGQTAFDILRDCSKKGVITILVANEPDLRRSIDAFRVGEAAGQFELCSKS